MWRSVVTPLYVYLYLSLVWLDASLFFVWCLVIPQLCLRSWICCFVSSKSFDGQITLICLFIHPFQPVPYLKQLQIHCDSLGFILLLSCAWFHTVSILALLHLGLASLMSVISCNLRFQPWPFSHNKGVFRGGGRKKNSCSHHIGNWHFHSSPPPSPPKKCKRTANSLSFRLHGWQLLQLQLRILHHCPGMFPAAVHQHQASHRGPIHQRGVDGVLDQNGVCPRLSMSNVNPGLINHGLLIRGVLLQ